MLSIGYNPYYKNTERSVEIHILSPSPTTSSVFAAHSTPGSASLPADFYGSPLNLLLLGFIRPEADYVSVEKLIEDISIDCEVARRSLDRAAYRSLRSEKWLQDFSWADGDQVNADGEMGINKEGQGGKVMLS